MVSDEDPIEFGDRRRLRALHLMRVNVERDRRASVGHRKSWFL